MTRLRRRALGQLGGALVAVALSLATLELGLRVFPRAIPLAVLAGFPEALRAQLAQDRPVTRREQKRALPRDDGGPELLVFRPGARLRAHAPDAGMVAEVELDAEGFCNPPDAAPGGRADVVAVGDSFTYCTTVAAADAWPAVLARLLHQSVYNLGLPGVGLYEYVQLLKQIGLEKHPRTVVMNVYEGNDLRDAVLYGETRDRSGPPVPPGVARRVAEAICANAVLQRSYVAGFAAGVLLAASRDPSEAPGIAKREGRRSRDVDFRYRLEFAGREIPFNPENTDHAEVVYADLRTRNLVRLDLFEPALAAYAGLARERGFTPVLAYTPSAHTTYEPFVRFDDPAVAPLVAEQTRAQRAFFADRAAALGLAFLDLTEPLRAAARKLQGDDLLYFPTNLHLTPVGHRVIATALADFLETRAGALAPPSTSGS